MTTTVKRRILHTIPVYEDTTPMESWAWIVEMDGTPINVPVIGWANIETITNSNGDSVSILLDDRGERIL